MLLVFVLHNRKDPPVFFLDCLALNQCKRKALLSPPMWLSGFSVVKK
jgi:hypothetical protein